MKKLIRFAGETKPLSSYEEICNDLCLSLYALLRAFTHGLLEGEFFQDGAGAATCSL